MTIKDKLNQFKKKVQEKQRTIIDATLVSTDISDQRYAVCVDCPHLTKLTSQCSKCGCFMKVKTKLKGAVCPIGKW